MISRINTNTNIIQPFSFISTQLNRAEYFYVILIIQFNISHLFVNSQMVTSTLNDYKDRFDSKMGPIQTLPLQVRVNLRVMAMKSYLTTAHLESHYQKFYCHFQYFCLSGVYTSAEPQPTGIKGQVN